MGERYLSSGSNEICSMAKNCWERTPDIFHTHIIAFFSSSNKKPEVNIDVSVGDKYLELVVDRIREGKRNLKEYMI